MNSISPKITRKTFIDDTAIITPAEVGDWLNLSSGLVTKHTAMIQQLIDTAVEVVETYAWIALRRTTYEADFYFGESSYYSFLDGSLMLSLQRAPILALADITKIEYLDTDGTYKEFSRGALTAEGLYENTTEKKELRQWASVYFDTSIPYDPDRTNAYKIRVTFTAGFTIDTDITTDIPQALKTALLMIVSYYYTNRGDCSGCGCDLNGYPVPCESKGLIDQFSVSKTTVGVDYAPEGDCGCYFG